MDTRTQNQISSLTITKQAYSELVLCHQLDPYKAFMQQKDKSIRACVGVVNSNLFAMVKIKNSGNEAKRYRQIANKLLFENKTLQEEICAVFTDRYKTVEFYKTKNPLLICFDETSEKTVWHHSPNHILTVSLIPEKIHREYKKALHYDGNKGGNAMFTVP